MKGVPTILTVLDMTLTTVGAWGTRSKTWSTEGCWSSCREGNENLLLRIFHLKWLVQTKKLLFIRMFKLYFFFIFQTIIVITNFITLSMHRICLFWINIFAFAIFKLFSYFCDDQLSIKNSKPLEGGWRKRYHNLQYAFEQTPLMRYRHCFNS